MTRPKLVAMMAAYDRAKSWRRRVICRLIDRLSSIHESGDAEVIKHYVRGLGLLCLLTPGEHDPDSRRNIEALLAERELVGGEERKP